MNSLQGRLTAGLLTSLIAVFVLQWALVSWAIQRVTENYVASRLEHEIESLLVALTFDAQGQPVLDTSRLNPVYHRPYSGHYFRIMVSGEVLRSRSLWDTDLSIPVLQPGNSTRLYRQGPQNQALLVLVQGYRKQGEPLTVAVAEDISPIQRDITRFQSGYAGLTALILVALVLLQRLMVRRAMKPLDEARQNVANLEQGNVQELDETVPQEIKPLVHEINRLIQLTIHRLTRSRNAVGNLAHALKTPLTVLNQIAGDKALESQPETRSSIRAQIDIMRRLIDRELKRARLAGEGPSGTQFVAESEIPVLIDALQHIYGSKSIEIEAHIPAKHTFAGDREDMLELFGNLLDNACKSAGHKVRLTIEDRPGVSLTIEDDGPGVSADELDRLTQRGVRLDESTEGHGLGLAIVRDIVSQYEGNIRFGRSETLGGFRVHVDLPARTPA